MNNKFNTIIITFLSFFISANLLAQPINDDFANAIDVTSLLGNCSADAAYTTSGATSDLGTGSCWNNSGPNFNVWFKFKVPSTGQVYIRVNRGGTLGNIRRTQLALWENDGITQVACDRYNFDTENVDLGAVGLSPGDTFYISVDVFNGSYIGDFTLCLDSLADYDFFEGAIDINPLLGTCSTDGAYSTTGASSDQIAGSCWNNSGPNFNRWFRFTAPSTGTIKVTVERGGSKGDQRRTQLALWEKNGISQIACDRYNFDAENVDLGVVGLTPGDTFYISVDAFNGAYTGSFTLCIDTIPDYDFYEGAIDINPFLGSCSPDAAYSTVGASSDQSIASCWNLTSGGPEYNRWFRFTAPLTGTVKITVNRGAALGTQRRTQLALWEKDGVTEVACDRYNFDTENVDIGAVGLTPGDTFYISVDAFNNAYSGSFTLCVDTIPDYDFYEGAIDLTPILGSCSPDAEYSTVGASPDFNAGSCWNNSGPNFNRWFKFKAPSTGIVNISVNRGGAQGTQRRTQLALWENDGITEVTCDRYSFDNENVDIGAIGLNPGDTFYLSVDAFNGSYNGSFTICIDTIADYDFYEGAIDLTPILGTCSPDAEYSTVGASSDLFAGSCWNNSGPNFNRWFKFKAPSTGIVNITVNRGGAKGTQRRTQIALWENNGITEVACERYNFDNENVDIGAIGLNPGDTFYISVDAFNGSYNGSFTLCIDTVASYDFYEGAIDITPFMGDCSPNAVYSTVGATPDINPGSCWNNSGPNFNRWFKFTAPASGFINIKIQRGGSLGTQRRTQAAIWEADGITEVVCNRYNFDNENVEIGSINLSPGLTYFLSVDAFNGSYNGSFTLCIEDEPSYDFFEGAIELTDLNNWCSQDAAFSTTGGTPDLTSASCWNNSGPRFNRWFKFQAISPNVTITIDRGGSKGTQRRTQLALWEDNGTTQRQCSRYSFDNEVVSLSDGALVIGNWYYVSVDAFNGSYNGSFTFCIDNVDEEYYSISDGNWNNPSTWSIVSHVGGAAATFPTAGDVVYIEGHEISLNVNESCAEIRMTVANDQTSLRLNTNRTLNVQGKVRLINPGNNFNGNIELQSNSSLIINDSLVFQRNGGDALFGLTAANNAQITVNKSLRFRTTGGTVNNTNLTLNGNASLTVNRNIDFNHTAGIKSQLIGNTNSTINVRESINFSGTGNNQMEIEMNNNALFFLGKTINLGSPAYGIMSFNGNSIFELNGATKQIVPSFDGSGSGDVFDIPRIRINNTFGAAPQLELSDDLQITQQLNFVDGIIAGNGNLLTFVSGASAVGDNNNSFVDGQVRFLGNGNAHFPTGNLDVWAPVDLANLSGDAATEFTVQYTFGAFGNNAVSAPLFNASILEFWDIENTGTASNADVILTWKSATRSEIDDFADLVVAHFNSGTSRWESLGKSSIVGANPGSIRINNVSSFSPFTFGSEDPISNPLPVTLTDFKGKITPFGNALIEWNTQTEINNDYFTLERSNNGFNYYQIAEIKGNGNSQSPIDYQFTDHKKLEGATYYRLSQTDFDGSTTEFKPIVLDFHSNELESKIYPNPSDGNQISIEIPSSFIGEPISIQLLKSNGQLISKNSFTLTDLTTKTIDFHSKLASGIYIVEISSNANRVFHKLIVK